MKNTSFYILIILVFSLASCEKDNQNEIYDLGTEFLISNNGYSSLDTDVTFSIDNQQKNLSEIIMLDHGTIAITDGLGNITLTSAQLGISAADDAATYQFDATFDGKAIQRFASLTISNPMDLTSPYIWTLNDDDPPVIVETPVTVYQNNDVQYIKYSVSPERATVESTLIETKIGEDGTYTVVTGDYDITFDSLSIVGMDYSANDDVYFRFTSKNGSHEQVGVINFTVNQVVFPHTGGALLGVIDAATTQGFNLVTNEIVTDGTGDFAMTHVLLTSVGFESSNGTLFVSTDATVYDNNDVVEVKALFDAGTQESGFGNISEGNYFIYKTGDNYGVIKISAVYLTTDGLGDYFEFEYIY